MKRRSKLSISYFDANFKCDASVTHEKEKHLSRSRSRSLMELGELCDKHLLCQHLVEELVSTKTKYFKIKIAMTK